jgi:hypothetical protein
VQTDRRFKGAHCRDHHSDELLVALMMEALSTSETSVNFYETTQLNITENIHLHLQFFTATEVFVAC